MMSSSHGYTITNISGFDICTSSFIYTNYVN